MEQAAKKISPRIDANERESKPAQDFIVFIRGQTQVVVQFGF
jgi:hypothetical protein